MNFNLDVFDVLAAKKLGEEITAREKERATRLRKIIVLESPKSQSPLKINNGGEKMAKEEKEKKEKKEPKDSKSKIECTKCGEVKSVRPDVFEKRVEKFGSEAKLRANYLCRECRPKAEKKESKKEKKQKKDEE